MDRTILHISRKKAYSIEEYLLSFQMGESTGFDYFFREHYAALCYFANRFVKNRAAAEDIVSECYSRLWERRTILKKPQAIKSYLYIIVRNTCLNFLRQQRSTVTVQREVATLPDETQPIVNDIIRAETINEIYLSLNSLPPKCRQVFRMFYIQGKGHTQIAEELHLSPHTIRHQKARALSLLRRKLQYFLFMFF